MQVIDVNDEAPVFQRAEFEALVIENKGPGTTVLKVSAVDRDQGGFSICREKMRTNVYKSVILIERQIVNCFLGVWVNAGSNGHVTYGGVTEEGFVINPVTGVITTTKELDTEAQDHYTLTGTTVGSTSSL